MPEDRIAKKLLSDVPGALGRRRPSMWEGKMEQYVKERKSVWDVRRLEGTKQACSDREVGEISAMAADTPHPPNGELPRARHPR